jgi:hypothetical protein
LQYPEIRAWFIYYFDQQLIHEAQIANQNSPSESPPANSSST